MSTVEHEAALGDDAQLRRHLGTTGILFTAVGAIIGSGWLFGALTAAKLAGPAAIFSWIIGAVMMMFIGLVYAELGTMFPHTGGATRFPHYAFGSFTSFTMGWITWLAVATVAPVEVEGALTYATSYVPGLMHNASGVAVLTGPGYGAAAGPLALFCVINFFGVRWFSRVNQPLVWWKLFIVILVIVVFLVGAFHPSHFTDHGFAPDGLHGILTSLPAAGIVFSYLGFRPGVEMAGETKNPSRNVPLTLIGSLLITAVLYIGVQIAFTAAVPGTDIARGWATALSSHPNLLFGPLAYIAGAIGLGWLASTLYVDAFISPADTGMIYTTLTTRMTYAMGRNRNVPTSVAKVSRRGVPWVALIVTFIVGLIFFLPFPSWTALVGFVSSAAVLSFGSAPVALLAMRRQLPDWPRPFRLAGGYLIPFLAFWAANLLVYWSGWSTDWRLFVAVLIGFVIFGTNQIVNKAHAPRVDFRHGWWILPWFAGLAVISYLGTYPQPGAGNLGVLPYGWAVLLGLSAVIMWLAHCSRLPDRRVREQFGQPSAQQIAST